MIDFLMAQIGFNAHLLFAYLYSNVKYSLYIYAYIATS